MKNRPPRAIIQYNTIAHYRRPIFKLLSQCQAVDFRIFSDISPDQMYLKTVDDDDLADINFVRVRTRQVAIPGLPKLSLQPSSVVGLWRARPDVVIALGTPYSLTAWALVLIGKGMGVPVLLWTHGLRRDESGPKWWVRSALYRLSAGFLLYGNHAKELLAKKGFSEERLHVVYNSLDYDRQLDVMEKLAPDSVPEWRRNLGVRPEERLVVFTGRLQPSKRLDLLLDAIGILAARNRRVHVALVGEGEARSRLTAQAKRDGTADLVHFLGESYDEEFLGLVFSASDLCVVPSDAGLSVIHSLVFGTPVLLHDNLAAHGPEWEAVEEGRTGFFYRYNNREDLATKLEGAVFPTSQREKLAENCKEVVRSRYNPHLQVDVFVEAVRRCLESRNRT